MAASGVSALPLPSTPPAQSPLARAEQFVWLTARVLEQRVFAHQFLHGDADPVETALDAYRNDDGGYGHALEPDLRGPESRPRHTARALHVLDALGRCGGQRVERACRYLTSVSTADGALPGVPPGRSGRPAARPAAHLAAPPVEAAAGDPPGELLATGPVVGLLHRNEVWHAWLFRATEFCWQAVDRLETSHPHEIRAAAAFLDSVPDRPRAQAAADRLGRLLRAQRLAVLDPDRLDTHPEAPGDDAGGQHFAYDFATRPDSIARAWFTDDEMARSLDFLAAQQQEDGGWPVRRRRAPGAALEARPMITIEALRTLRAHGRSIG